MLNVSTGAPPQIQPLQESDLGELSHFLCTGFHISTGDVAMFSPEALFWRYFAPRPTGQGPRSFVVKKNQTIVAHVGVTTTEFITGVNGSRIPAVFMIDWLSSERAGMFGAAVLLHAASEAPVQYSLGTTAVGREVFLGSGFKIVNTFPVFNQVFSPKRQPVWSFLHGLQSPLRMFALRSLDLGQVFLGRFRNPAVGSLKLRQVSRFGREVKALFDARQMDVFCTSRDPELLNYFLQTPQRNITGWMLEQDGNPIGFALLSVVRRDGLVRGHIMDCFLPKPDAKLWAAAIRLLTLKLKSFGCEMARCMASIPLLEQAARSNGFFRRGRGVFFLRDPGNLLALDRPLLLSDLEGDASY